MNEKNSPKPRNNLKEACRNGGNKWRNNRSKNKDYNNN